jgi:LCP family protein required for cell wall assembly
MVSFLRDTYIQDIPGYNRADKLNAPYCFGGAPALNKTLEQYFGVHVDANVAVQFDGFVGIIDMLGGVDIELTQKEAQYMTENNTHGWVFSKGMHHMNGIQTLLYSRIRKIDGDAKRTERQRKVIMAVIDAYKNKSLPEMLSLATQILETGFVETDMSAEQVLTYVKEIFPIFASMNIRSQQIPAEGTYENMKVGNVVDTKVCDLDRNRKILEELFK